jgi:plasmid stabilization system protein ParE
MTYRVIITAQALDKISEQVEFIAVKSSAPLNAARWLERVFDAAESLESMPRRFPSAPESAHHAEDVRAFSIDGFLLLFVIRDADQTVHILSARHGRQLPQPDDLTMPCDT